MGSEANREVLFATADEARADFLVFSEVSLRDIAAKDSRCRYDEATRQLWVKIGIEGDRSLEPLPVESGVGVRHDGNWKRGLRQKGDETR